MQALWATVAGRVGEFSKVDVWRPSFSYDMPEDDAVYARTGNDLRVINSDIRIEILGVPRHIID